MTEFDPEIMRAEAEKCFRSAFDGTLTIICRADQQFGKSETPEVICVLHIDGHASPPVISIATQETIEPPESNGSNGISPGACTWRASHQVLQRIFLGDRQLTSAYISGRLIISGDMAVMARLKLTDSASSRQHQ